MFILRPFVVVSALCLLAVAPLGMVMGQERAAGGAIDIETTWASIAGKLNATNMKAQSTSIRLDQAQKCAAKKRTYAPGITGADHEGCLSPYYSSTILNKLIACGNQGLIYSQATDRCQSTIEKVQVCRMQTTTIVANQNSGVRCPAGYTHISTVFSHYKKPRYKDGCETCNPQYATTCGRLVCEWK